MPHFLIKKEYIKDNIITVLDKQTAAHLAQSLRVKKGEDVKFIDDNENVYFCKIENAAKNQITARILFCEKSKRKLDFPLCAAISILKPDAMALAIQNAVQLGAKEIYPVYSNNCAVKRNSIDTKKEKWEKYALEAFKQCERADLPKIHTQMGFEEIFSKFKKHNILIFAEKYDECSLKNALSGVDFSEKILAVFGPEGGFSEHEFEYFKGCDLKLVSLGSLILKAPNAVCAGLFGISQYER